MRISITVAALALACLLFAVGVAGCSRPEVEYTTTTTEASATTTEETATTTTNEQNSGTGTTNGGTGTTNGGTATTDDVRNDDRGRNRGRD